ncbi:MAG TPA: hypothetical protein VJ877_00715 [Bacteroidales bacterium]|nr:hypothetical protein [Bacteroidales bacterium]
MKYFPIIITYIFLLAPPATGQVSDTATNDTNSVSLQPEHPFVYLDCPRCDFNFIRTELDYVNYVRDPAQADIHVFITNENTSGGGRECLFSFIGRRKFAGTEYTMKHYIEPNATRDEQRKAINRFLTMGYASFILQTPQGYNFLISYSDSSASATKEKSEDPWDYWVFRSYVGGISLELESNQRRFDSRWGIFADRVTDEWKFRIRPYFNFNSVFIQASEASDPVSSSQHRHGLDSYAIMSLNDHWSAGMFGKYFTASSRNIKHEIMMSPGIEYSLFPYSEATRKAITLTYQLGLGYYDYYKETIYSVTEEVLFSHQLKGMINIKQPWGSIETGLVGSAYLHDFDRRRVEIYTQISGRLFEGFSLSVQADYNILRDQMSLPRGEASLEDILLWQSEIATDFSFSGTVAITYTFGSKYTNIVNTRF